MLFNLQDLHHPQLLVYRFRKHLLTLRCPLLAVPDHIQLTWTACLSQPFLLHNHTLLDPKRSDSLCRFLFVLLLKLNHLLKRQYQFKLMLRALLV